MQWGRFFPRYADIPAIIDNMKANKDSTSYNNSFLYPRSGAGSFIQILYDALDKEKVLLNHVVDKIDRANKKVILNDGSEISYEYLINTSPLNRFLTLFDEETNPVDKIIMKVLYRKQDQIRKSLGIYIPIADNDSSLMESIMEEIIVLDTKKSTHSSAYTV